MADVKLEKMNEGDQVFDVDPCYPEYMGQLGKWHASGCAPVVPEGVDYNPINDDSFRAPDWYVKHMIEEANDHDEDDAS